MPLYPQGLSMRCDPGHWAVDIHVDPHVRNCWFYHDFPGKTHHLQLLHYVYELFCLEWVVGLSENDR